jgi:iron complex transport system permease protein
MKPIESRFLIPALGLLAAIIGIAALFIGKVSVPLSVWMDQAQDPRWIIIMELRIPRSLLGLAVGAALGASGAALQGFTRNPLADPGVLGVSSCAALGAVAVIYFGMGYTQPYLPQIAAVTGAGIGITLLLALAGNSSSMTVFLLAGVILNIIGTAAVDAALSLAPNPWAAQEIINWLFGSLVDRSMNDVQFACLPILAGIILLLSQARNLDALTLGEEGARALGVNLTRMRVILVLGVGLAIGASVAVTGIIGFVGLVVPHLMRPLVGHRPGALIAPSALAGAALLTAADILVRAAPSAVEIRLGIAMSILGGPFFLGLLLSLRRRLI